MEDRTRDIYRRRFSGKEELRVVLWRVLIDAWFQKYVDPATDRLLEIAAGRCEFINQIAAKEKIATDVNPDSRIFAADTVRFVQTRSSDLSPIDDESIDKIWVSNFFEHITKEEILRTLAECRRILRPGGEIMILQPNIRYCGRDYWMFFDHITPIDDRALCEALEISGFTCRLVIPRFLPYTTSSSLPTASWLVRLYLKIPLAWHLYGGQAFVIARR